MHLIAHFKLKGESFISLSVSYCFFIGSWPNDFDFMGFESKNNYLKVIASY